MFDPEDLPPLPFENEEPPPFDDAPAPRKNPSQGRILKTPTAEERFYLLGMRSGLSREELSQWAAQRSITNWNTARSRFLTEELAGWQPFTGVSPARWRMLGGYGRALNLLGVRREKGPSGYLKPPDEGYYLTESGGKHQHPESTLEYSSWPLEPEGEIAIPSKVYEAGGGRSEEEAKRLTYVDATKKYAKAEQMRGRHEMVFLSGLGAPFRGFLRPGPKSLGPDLYQLADVAFTMSGEPYGPGQLRHEIGGEVVSPTAQTIFSKTRLDPEIFLKAGTVSERGETLQWAKGFSGARSHWFQMRLKDVQETQVTQKSSPHYGEWAYTAALERFSPTTEATIAAKEGTKHQGPYWPSGPGEGLESGASVQMVTPMKRLELVPGMALIGVWEKAQRTGNKKALDEIRNYFGFSETEDLSQRSLRGLGGKVLDWFYNEYAPKHLDYRNERMVVAKENLDYYQNITVKKEALGDDLFRLDLRFPVIVAPIGLRTMMTYGHRRARVPQDEAEELRARYPETWEKLYKQGRFGQRSYQDLIQASYATSTGLPPLDLWERTHNAIEAEVQSASDPAFKGWLTQILIMADTNARKELKLSEGAPVPVTAAALQFWKLYGSHQVQSPVAGGKDYYNPFANSFIRWEEGPGGLVTPPPTTARFWKATGVRETDEVSPSALRMYEMAQALVGGDTIALQRSIQGRTEVIGGKEVWVKGLKDIQEKLASGKRTLDYATSLFPSAPRSKGEVARWHPALKADEIYIPGADVGVSLVNRAPVMSSWLQSAGVNIGDDAARERGISFSAVSKEIMESIGGDVDGDTIRRILLRELIVKPTGEVVDSKGNRIDIIGPLRQATALALRHGAANWLEDRPGSGTAEEQLAALQRRRAEGVTLSVTQRRDLMEQRRELKGEIGPIYNLWKRAVFTGSQIGPEEENVAKILWDIGYERAQRPAPQAPGMETLRRASWAVSSSVRQQAWSSDLGSRGQISGLYGMSGLRDSVIQGMFQLVSEEREDQPKLLPEEMAAANFAENKRREATSLIRQSLRLYRQGSKELAINGLRLSITALQTPEEWTETLAGTFFGGQMVTRTLKEMNDPTTPTKRASVDSLGISRQAVQRLYWKNYVSQIWQRTRQKGVSPMELAMLQEVEGLDDSRLPLAKPPGGEHLSDYMERVGLQVEQQEAGKPKKPIVRKPRSWDPMQTLTASILDADPQTDEGRLKILKLIMQRRGVRMAATQAMAGGQTVHEMAQKAFAEIRPDTTIEEDIPSDFEIGGIRIVGRRDVGTGKATIDIKTAESDRGYYAYQLSAYRYAFDQPVYLGLYSRNLMMQGRYKEAAEQAIKNIKRFKPVPYERVVNRAKDVMAMVRKLEPVADRIMNEEPEVLAAIASGKGEAKISFASGGRIKGSALAGNKEFPIMAGEGEIIIPRDMASATERAVLAGGSSRLQGWWDAKVGRSTPHVSYLQGGKIKRQYRTQEEAFAEVSRLAGWNTGATANPEEMGPTEVAPSLEEVSPNVLPSESLPPPLPSRRRPRAAVEPSEPVGPPARVTISMERQQNRSYVSNAQIEAAEKYTKALEGLTKSVFAGIQTQDELNSDQKTLVSWIKKASKAYSDLDRDASKMQFEGQPVEGGRSWQRRLDRAREAQIQLGREPGFQMGMAAIQGREALDEEVIKQRLLAGTPPPGGGGRGGGWGGGGGGGGGMGGRGLWGLGDLGWTMFNVQRVWRWTGGAVSDWTNQYAQEQMVAQGINYNLGGGGALTGVPADVLRRRAQQSYMTSQLGEAAGRTFGPGLDWLTQTITNAPEGQQDAIVRAMGYGGAGLAASFVGGWGIHKAVGIGRVVRNVLGGASEMVGKAAAGAAAGQVEAGIPAATATTTGLPGILGNIAGVIRNIVPLAFVATNLAGGAGPSQTQALVGGAPGPYAELARWATTPVQVGQNWIAPYQQMGVDISRGFPTPQGAKAGQYTTQTGWEWFAREAGKPGAPTLPQGQTLSGLQTGGAAPKAITQAGTISDTDTDISKIVRFMTDQGYTPEETYSLINSLTYAGGRPVNFGQVKSAANTARLAGTTPAGLVGQIQGIAGLFGAAPGTKAFGQIQQQYLQASNAPYMQMQQQMVGQLLQPQIQAGISIGQFTPESAFTAVQSSLAPMYGALAPQMALAEPAMNQLFSRYGVTTAIPALMATVPASQGGMGMTQAQTNFMSNWMGSQAGWATSLFSQAGGGRPVLSGAAVGRAGMNAFGGQGWQYGGYEWSPQYGTQTVGFAQQLQMEEQIGGARAAAGIASAQGQLQLHQDFVGLTQSLRENTKAQIAEQRGYALQQFAFQRERAGLSLEQGMESIGLSEQIFQAQKRYQAQEQAIAVTQFAQQAEWKRQDFSYQQSMMGLQYGWQQEDIGRSIRFATGRERQQLIRQQERGQITYSMQQGQLSRERERFEIQTDWTQARMAREKQQFNEITALQQQQFDMQRRHLVQNYDLQMRQIAAAEAHEKRMWALQDEERKLQNDYQDKELSFRGEELKRSLALAKLSAEQFKEQMQRQKEIAEANKAYEDSIYAAYRSPDGTLYGATMTFFDMMITRIQDAVEAIKNLKVGGGTDTKPTDTSGSDRPPQPKPTSSGTTPTSGGQTSGSTTTPPTRPAGSGQQMAEGGIVTRGIMAMIGESGPEAIIPLHRMGQLGITTQAPAPQVTVHVYLGEKDITDLVAVKVVGSPIFEAGLNDVVRRQRNRYGLH
jgi:hypothetical protein